MNLLYPVPSNSIVSQTYQEHVDWAKENDKCSQPGGACPNGYYYGGIDYAVKSKTPIAAALAASVYFAGWDKPEGAKDVPPHYGYGLHVKTKVTIGSVVWSVIYAHLDTILVKIGDTIRAGQQIALSDDSGNSSGPHLHFELRKGGNPTDPQPYLTGQVIPPQPQPEPTPTPQPLPAFPKLVQVQLTTTLQLAIHTEPTIGSAKAGYLLPGAGPLDVLRAIQDGDDLVTQIGYRQFIYLRYHGDEWYRWLPSTS